MVKKNDSLTWVLDREGEFTVAWDLLRNDPKFRAHCTKDFIDEEEQKYLVATVVHYKLNETERCEVIGLPYNLGNHQKYKKNHDQGGHASLRLLIVEALKEARVRTKRNPNKPKTTDLEKLEEVIAGDHKVTDMLKAMELKQKLTEKQQGTHQLKPWERIWIEVIIPNMLARE